MFCSHCGEKVVEGNQFCTKCGERITNQMPTTYVSNEDKSVEGKRTASIVLGCLSLFGVFVLFLAPISFILSIIGLILGIKANKAVKNTAGIVLNAVSLFLSFILVCIIALLLLFTTSIIRNGPVDYGNVIDNFIEEYSTNNHDF